MKQTTVFNVSFHLRAIFKMLFGNSLILPAALSARFFDIFGVLVSFRVANAVLVDHFFICTVVGGRRFRPRVAVVDEHRFRATSGHLESTSVFIMFVQQQSEPLVDERNMLSTMRTYRSKRNLLSGASKFSPYGSMLLYQRALAHVLLLFRNTTNCFGDEK